MKSYTLLAIKNFPSRISDAAKWFSEKWGIAEVAYRESMEACVQGEAPVPQWYLMMDEEKIIAGLGVIENDFHERHDLTPNICAVYVEEAYRQQGIAGELLHFACAQFHQMGIDTLYLVTEHRGFYERYGFEFLCMVKESECDHMTRMYRYVFGESAK